MSIVRQGWRLWLRVSAVTLTFGLVQAALETAAVALLYRDLLFAPYRFFTLQIYDAFTKLYFLATEYVTLPDALDTFLGVGVLEKLRLFPELAAVNSIVALVLAFGMLPVCAWFGVREDLPRRAFVRRVALLTCLIVVGVHLASWGLNVKVPMDASVRSVMSNLIRDALLDGVAVAMIVGLAATAATVAVTPRGAVVAFAAMAASAPTVSLRSAARAAPAATVRSVSAPATGYNVVLISVDSLRADHLGTYGYPKATSPALDRMAGDGIVFERCQSTTSWTLPAHMSLLTGRSLLGHGVVGDDRRLDPSVPTLAQALQAAGYATGAVVSAPYLESRFGFAAGFDSYDDRTISFDSNEESYRSVTAPLVNETAERWIASQAGKPFFLFLHYWDVHYDYAPGAPYDTMFDPDYRGSMDGVNFYFNPAVNSDMDQRDLEHILALYDGEIRLVDDHLGKLREALQRLGVAEKTIIVVVADHGDEFFEHGNKGHHRTLYHEVLRVPCVLYVPSRVIAPRRITEEASIIDMMPTLLGLTGVGRPEGVEGTDFTNALLGAERPRAPRTVFAELYRKGSLNVQVAAVSERAKLVQHFNARQAEFYDLTADPSERVPRPLDEARPAFVSLREWLETRWVGYRRRESAHGVQKVEIDARTAETLRSLGYVQ